MGRKAVSVVIFVLLLTRAAVAQETVESVEKKVTQAWDKVQSYTATMTLEASVSKMFMTLNTKATGPFEFLKIDNKPRYRSELTNKVSTSIPLPENMSTQTILTVFDGTTIYSEMKAMGQTQVVKRNPDSPSVRTPEGGDSLFAKLRAKGTLKVLPDETVDGIPAYVLEIAPNAAYKKEDPSKSSVMKVYLARDSGIQIKMVALDDSGTPVTTIHYTDIKLNAKIDPNRFVYKAPPGVKVTEGWDGKSASPAL